MNKIIRQNSKREPICLDKPARAGFTIIELLVVIAVIGLLLALLLPAVQKSRAAASRIECLNKLRQIGLGVLQLESTYGSFPAGKVDGSRNPQQREMSWFTAILPYCDQSALWNESRDAYDVIPFPYFNPPHTPLARPVVLFSCPMDSRTDRPQSASTLNGAFVGLTSYLGVCGKNRDDRSGVLFFGTAIRTADIVDGLSNTLLAGERPPSPDFNLGWWYTGAGQDESGNVDLFLGAAETLAVPNYSLLPDNCPPISKLSPGDLNNLCHALHFWSLHDGGAQFVRCDGSAGLISYEAADLLEHLATRNGGEVD